MKSLFAIFVLILLLNSCNISERIESNVDFLHDIAPFTSDSLVHVVIEIPAGTRQKWEVNNETGKIEWEKITTDSSRVINYLPYPANYGFVPQTMLPKSLGGDGDPVDVFVLGSSINREEIIIARLVGIIHILDDNELDSKLLAVNTSERGFDVNSYEMLINKYPGIVEIIQLWLMNYKGNNEVKILSVNDEKDAFQYLRSANNDYINHK
ncbi:MAG: inorganic diphosphatase [Bacteroidota bacterium]